MLDKCVSVCVCVCSFPPVPPNPASAPFPLIQIKSFQTQISIIHLIQIMPCDKNYPYCNNPLNWERAAHQKEKRERGLDVRRVVVVGLVSRSQIRAFATRISSLFEEAAFKCARMMKLKQIERKPGRMLPQSINAGLN